MIGLYAVIPQRWRRGAICMFSLLFYTCASFNHPASLAFLIVCACFTYCAACAVVATKGRKVFAFSIVLVTGALVILRVLSFFSSESALPFLPLGAAFYLLSCISCIVDVKRGDAVVNGFFDVFLYISYFPVLIAGPVIKYKDFVNITKEENIQFGAANMGEGVRTFILGFVKRVGVAAFTLESYEKIAGSLSLETGERISPLVMVILTVLLLIGVYFAFSGFSDMGRGISMMLGIPLKPDFGNCLFAITPTDYFKNFIKSLWLWMKDYLREPIESRWGKKWRGGRIASTAVVCISIMLWYRANLQMLILMIPIILFIVLDRVFSLKKKLAANVAFRILSSLLTLMCIGMFWILIKSQNVYLLINAISGYNPAPSLQSYNMYMTVFSREIVAVCALIFFIMLPKIISSVKKTASKRGMAIFSWCWTSTLVVIFIITVLLVMPQYPELATTAFSGIML
jgi:D-alanyl-lipoteichoic acid acyltransferase DltB (MBOAT superfamily)